jgi:glycosyltransferase involved in cell wall biosynthesis
MSPEACAVEGANRVSAVSAEQSHPPRLLMVGSHFVQYASPVFRQIASERRIDLLVAYCSMQGAEAGIDPEFGVKVSWDTSLTEGYPWVYVPNRAPQPGLGRFLGLINPGLWKLIRDGNFDAILVSGYFYASAWIAIVAAKRHGIPLMFITDSHSLTSWAAQSKWKIRIKRAIVRRIFSLGKILLALSSGGVEHLEALGFSRERIVLTPYVVDNDWWTEQAAKIDRDAVRADWGISAGASVALFCAKLQPWKGPFDLLEAFARADVPESYLVFAGDGSLKNTLEQRAAELGIADRVRFLGFMNQSQLPAVYCASDVLVLPSHYEPFGLVVNEAMLCGCPAVVSDRVGARFDLVAPGQNGYVFPVGDADALAAILKAVLPDSGKRARMAAAARQRMKTWSPHEFADSVLRAVNRAVRGDL